MSNFVYIISMSSLAALGINKPEEWNKSKSLTTALPKHIKHEHEITFTIIFDLLRLQLYCKSWNFRDILPLMSEKKSIRYVLYDYEVRATIFFLLFSELVLLIITPISWLLFVLKKMEFHLILFVFTYSVCHAYRS